MMRKRQTGAAGILTMALVAATALGAAAQSDDQVASFDARFARGAMEDSGSTETFADRLANRGQRFVMEIRDASDARLDGELTYESNTDYYEGADGRHAVGVATYRIENADGAWEGSTPFFGDGLDMRRGVVVLVGEEGYEGLYAVLDVGADAVTGLILPAPPPAAPAAR